MLPSAVADLERSGIAPADADRAGFFTVDDASTIYSEFGARPAIVIPYYDAAGSMMQFDHRGNPAPFCRIRYLDMPRTSGFVKQKPQRYTQPRDSGQRVYFPPFVDWARIAADPKEPIVITEGEKKAIAGCVNGFPMIALGGVFNFMSTMEALLPELEAWQWAGRDVYVCFDSDAATNPMILTAEARLVDELQRKRGAQCYLTRLPQDGDDKVGVDDFLLKFGPPALMGLLQKSESLGALDAKVVALNQDVAWITRENMVYDLQRRMFLTKDQFVTGETYGSLTHITVGGAQRAPKRISIAKTWLTHPHAQRFSEVLFRPSEGVTVQGEHGRMALNLWTGFNPGAGDVKPFLELSEFLFQRMMPADRELPLKLMAYKAQNPHEKIPLALVLLGTQGCGKTLWGECIRDAFMPYAVDVTSKAFHSEFQGWLETSLIALINEAEHGDMLKGADVLKSLISDLKRPMNEKYRPARQINSYTMYILTSNSRAVGAFGPDDRRMIVVDCPPKRDWDFYDRISAWKRAGGPRALLGYLLAVDLKGWRPPHSAPLSHEKVMAFNESLTPIQRLAEQMKESKDFNIVMLWVQQATAWATVAELSNNPTSVSAAKATLENIKHFQIRPWYTPEELALLFPNVVETQLGSRYDNRTPSGVLSRQLREAGVPYLMNLEDPRGFKWKGLTRQYIVVCDLQGWEQPITQSDFERYMGQWPTYGQLTGRK